MEPVLQTQDLSKRYHRSYALNHVNLHVPKGSIYGLVGKNGAGKTTLFRLISGLQNPTEGSYSLFGVPNTSHDIGKARKRMSAIIESPAIYLNLSAMDNLKVQYQLLGLPSYRDIPELLNLVGLSDAGKKKAGRYSLGMRQRLGIAIALAGHPDFLLLDEPVNGLDPQGIVEMRELILKLNREQEVTIMISSHILDELSKLATHYGFIEKGVLLKERSAAEIERACRKCLHVTVSDTQKLAAVLEEKGIDYTILPEQAADIFGEIIITELVVALSAVGCEVISMQERDETLETFFINLVGG